MKIKLYRLPDISGDDKYVILTNYMSSDGRTCDDTYGNIYPRRFFETCSDPIHDFWGGDEIANMCNGKPGEEPELITEVEAIYNLSDEEIYENIESLVNRANRFARVLADESFAKKIEQAVKEGGEK